MRRLDHNAIIFTALIIVYLAGQILIGTYHPDENEFVFDAPADVDFLYYGAITNSLWNDFPPQNPAFCGINLTQPFLQFYPAAVLALGLDPFNSIRILNLLYLIVFGLVARKFFPARWGIALVVLFSASTIGASLNSLGVDFIARGFTHVPFFILLTVALFHKNLPARLVSVFAAALINGYSMLMIIPFLIILAIMKRRRDDYLLLAVSLAGFITAGLFISAGAAQKSPLFVITESFRFAPGEIIIHAVPIMIIAALCRFHRIYILLAAAILFGAFIHYNPFFPIFMIYYSGAMIAADAERRFGRSEMIIAAVAAVMIIGFFIAAFDKYDPRQSHYYPRYDPRQDQAMEWISSNTDGDDCFLALTADDKDIALVMVERPVYLGYIGHLAHLGLDWTERYNRTMQIFHGQPPPPEIDYIYYGPVEKTYFPGSSPPGRVVYRDSFVTILKNR